MLERMAKECRVLSHKSAYRSGFEWGSKRKTNRSLSTPALETEAKSKCVKLCEAMKHIETPLFRLQ